MESISTCSVAPNTRVNGEMISAFEIGSRRIRMADRKEDDCVMTRILDEKCKKMMGVRYLTLLRSYGLFCRFERKRQILRVRL